MFEKTVLLICDVWDIHWCKNLQSRVELLAPRINDFAQIIRRHGGQVLHCPSETADSYYGTWPQRESIKKYPRRKKCRVHQTMFSVETPLDTTLTAGCPDEPPCPIHTNFTKQHEGIVIEAEDLISDNGQEICNFLIHEEIQSVLMVGTVLNMCILGRPFGIQSLLRQRKSVKIVGDLVEVFYSSLDSPYITIEQAKWFTLGYIESKWCPITNVYKETRDLPKERNMKISTNLPGPLLSRYKNSHSLFVETGTAHGDTTELAAVMFDEVWSCDIDPGLVNKTAERLKGYGNVTLSRMLSPAFLKSIKDKLDRPTIYWLDAHWCGGPKMHKECPLLEEIQAIGSFNDSSVILIDDIELIDNPPLPPHDPKQWPTMEELRMAFDVWEEPYNFEWYQGPKSKILIVTLKGTDLLGSPDWRDQWEK